MTDQRRPEKFTHIDQIATTDLEPCWLKKKVFVGRARNIGIGRGSDRTMEMEVGGVPVRVPMNDDTTRVSEGQFVLITETGSFHCVDDRLVSDLFDAIS